MKPKTHTVTPAAKGPRKSPSAYGRDWQRFRRWYASVVPAVCVRCDAALESKLMHLDHIVPLEQGGARLSADNVQFLCRECHSKKTASEDNGFGRLE
jgi:5-methylcytosine-specific restriction protein A